jgi:glycosyltransferase 2 family protein
MSLGRSQLLRTVLGLAVGLGLLAITLAQVDLAAVGAALVAADVSFVLLALAVVILDLLVRALRWQVLVDGTRPPTPPRLRLIFAYLNIGFLANLLLPARLGDVARAYLAGTSFGVSRLAVLGTVVVERVADGTLMVALAIGATLIVAGVAQIQSLALYGFGLALLGGLMIVAGWLLLSRTRVGRTRVGAWVHELLVRLAGGMAALRQPRAAAAVIIGTLAAAATATVVAWLAARSVGIELAPIEAVLLLSGIALSLAVPAAPAGLGAFELVGVVILTALGYPADNAFAAILVLRAVTLLPPVSLGLVAVWVLHLRPAAIVEASVEGSAAEPSQPAG